MRLSGVAAPLRLRLIGVSLGRGCNFTGMPFVHMHDLSTITLGNEVRIVSWSRGTALGVSHACVLRTLAEGAAIRIGDRSGISGGSICAARSVEVGSDCLLGADVLIADTDFHSLAAAKRHDAGAGLQTARPVLLGNNVFLGARAIVLKGVTIGNNSVIGAGSVVTKSIPANVIAAGNPCRVISKLPA